MNGAIQPGFPGGGETIISATFWDVEPLGHNWGVQTVGLVKLEDTPEAREAGLTAYLLADALRHTNRLAMHSLRPGATSDASLRAILAELGLTEYDEGVLWAKG